MGVFIIQVIIAVQAEDFAASHANQLTERHALSGGYPKLFRYLYQILFIENWIYMFLCRLLKVCKFKFYTLASNTKVRLYLC